MVQAHVGFSVKFNPIRFALHLPEGKNHAPIGDKSSWVIGFFADLFPSEAFNEKVTRDLKVSDGQSNVVYSNRKRFFSHFSNLFFR